MDNITWQKASVFALWCVYEFALIWSFTGIPIGYLPIAFFLGLIPFRIRLVHEKTLNEMLRDLQRGDLA